MICRMAERFGAAPHEVYEWPVWTLRLLAIEAAGEVTRA